MVEVLRLSERTRFVLAAFAAINPSIVIRPGSTISTANPGTAKVAAVAVVDQVFDREIGIFSIPRFLAMMARFDDPVLVFGTNSNPDVVAIRDGSGRNRPGILRRPLARPGTIPIPPDQEPMFEVDTAIDLPGSELAWTLAAAKAADLRDLVVVGAGGRVELRAETPCRENGEPHRAYTVIGETDREFKVVLRAANVRRLMPADYAVEVGYRGLAVGEHVAGVARFTAAAAGMTYWVEVEPESEPADAEHRRGVAEAAAERRRRLAEATAELEARKAAETMCEGVGGRPCRPCVDRRRYAILTAAIECLTPEHRREVESYGVRYVGPTTSAIGFHRKGPHTRDIGRIITALTGEKVKNVYHGVAGAGFPGTWCEMKKAERRKFLRPKINKAKAALPEEARAEIERTTIEFPYGPADEVIQVELRRKTAAADTIRDAIAKGVGLGVAIEIRSPAPCGRAPRA